MSTSDIRHDSQCRLCGSSSIEVVLSLAPTPPEDMFMPTEQSAKALKAYPLDLALCRGCGYVHLCDILSPQVSYASYLYKSTVTLGLGDHYDSYAAHIIDTYSIQAGSAVVDLGSNDGTLLSGFKKRGMRVLGVEPARQIAEAAHRNGIPTMCGFFNHEAVQEIVSSSGRPAVITANYMYANIDDLHTFTRNVESLLADDGIFVIQTGYHPDQMKIFMFDYIYHEHFSYFTVSLLDAFLARYHLQVIDVQSTHAKGGSIRLVAQKKSGRRKRNESVERYIQAEKDAEMTSPATYKKFGLELAEKKSTVHAMLQQTNLQGKKIVGYGASHSTTTLLYHFELGPYLSYLVDDNPIKHGTFSPGLHLPVHPASRLLEDKPDYVVILAWQYQDSIYRRNQDYLRFGSMIAPLPSLRIEGRERD
jgi:hypothetical protein